MPPQKRETASMYVQCRAQMGGGGGVLLGAEKARE